MITIGSCFAGIGGFDLAFERAGMVVKWQCERDKHAIKILRRHFPGAKIIEDIRDVNKESAESVNVICGGFPCQDVSLAGKRAGLAGGRSGLWFEFARVINEFNPRIAVIENVPGLLSSHAGKDFAVIIGGLTGVIPAIPDGGWENAGIAWGYPDRYKVCWRVFDSQYDGVAQRRRRVYIVASLRDGSAAEILFDREGMQWDSQKVGEPREETAFTLRASAKGSVQNGYGQINGNLIAGTLDRKSCSADRGCNGNETDFLAYTIQQNDGGEHKRKDRPNGGFYINQTDTSLTVGSTDLTAICCMGNGHGNAEISMNRGNTLNCIHETQIIENKFIGVRRFMPVECERLQGFPDQWTGGQPDSERYKQLGNAVCVNTVEWIGNKIKQCFE